MGCSNTRFRLINHTITSNWNLKNFILLYLISMGPTCLERGADLSRKRGRLVLGPGLNRAELSRGRPCLGPICPATTNTYPSKIWCMHFYVLISGPPQSVHMWQVPLCTLTVIGPEINTEIDGTSKHRCVDFWVSISDHSVCIQNFMWTHYLCDVTESCQDTHFVTNLAVSQLFMKWCTFEEWVF